MKSAFVCWRPYQVFNAINMVVNNIEDTYNECDIFIQNIPSLFCIYEKLKKIGIFNNVYLFDELNKGGSDSISLFLKLKIFFKRTFNFIFKKRALKKNCKEYKEDSFVNKYEKIFASGWISFFIELCNVNKNAKVLLFEDGTGSYFFDQIDSLNKKRKIYYTILSFFNAGPLKVKLDCLYVYQPSLILNKRKYEINTMPSLSREVLDILFKVFDSDVSIYKNKRIVFLDQPLTKGINKNFDKKILLNYFKNNDSFIYRRHPIQQKLNMDDVSEDINLPMWELVCSQFNENVVLVGAFSTAQLTTKILYNIEPIVVFTYKIDNDELSDNAIEFISKFKENYKNNIYEPSNYNELFEILKKYE